jgi:HSP20 family molecular chaperone IbpA
MTTISSPLMLGFDQFERLLDHATKSSSDGYPPYNVEKRGPEQLRITLAVAGFAEADLDVTVEDRQLVIRGRRQEPDEAVFLHRGIANRQFQRVFVLADGMEVGAASLVNGLLHIDVARPETADRSRRITIAGPSTISEGA